MRNGCHSERGEESGGPSEEFSTPALQHTIHPHASRGRTTPLLKGVVRSWFGLTADEQKAVLLVLGLFLLGLAARAWHVERTALEQPLPTKAAAPASAPK